MIIKRSEKDDKIKVIYKSSNILASTYDKTTNNLNIIFNNGGHYMYEGVKEADYTRFEIADSQGKEFNARIKHYSFQKLEKVDTQAILNEVAKMEDDRIKALEDTMMAFIIKALDYYNTEHKVPYNIIGDITRINARISDIKTPTKDESAG